MGRAWASRSDDDEVVREEMFGTGSLLRLDAGDDGGVAMGVDLADETEDADFPTLRTRCRTLEPRLRKSSLSSMRVSGSSVH